MAKAKPMNRTSGVARRKSVSAMSESERIGRQRANEVGAAPVRDKKASGGFDLGQTAYDWLGVGTDNGKFAVDPVNVALTFVPFGKAATVAKVAAKAAGAAGKVGKVAKVAGKAGKVTKKSEPKFKGLLETLNNPKKVKNPGSNGGLGAFVGEKIRPSFMESLTNTGKAAKGGKKTPVAKESLSEMLAGRAKTRELEAWRKKNYPDYNANWHEIFKSQSGIPAPRGGVTGRLEGFNPLGYSGKTPDWLKPKPGKKVKNPGSNGGLGAFVGEKIRPSFMESLSNPKKVKFPKRNSGTGSFPGEKVLKTPDWLKPKKGGK